MIEFLTTDELSARWSGKPSPATLRQWRYKNQGPPYIKIGGAVKYRMRDIETFEREGVYNDD